MKSDELEQQLRRGEYFHNLTVLPGLWTVLRVDGRGFSGLTERRYTKPFDPSFHEAMVATATELATSFQALYGYTESDEISILLPRGFDLFDREVEKLVSLSAATASASFSLRTGELACFDSRIWVAPELETVIDYFRWRQGDAARACLHSWCYWTLRQEGKSVGQATNTLKGMSASAKHELLFRRGTNFNDLPAWQRRGTGLYWEHYLKDGLNPQTGATTQVWRRRLIVDPELPFHDEYGTFLERIVSAEGSRRKDEG